MRLANRVLHLAGSAGVPPACGPEARAPRFANRILQPPGVGPQHDVATAMRTYEATARPHTCSIRCHQHLARSLAFAQEFKLAANVEAHRHQGTSHGLDLLVLTHVG